MNTFGNNFRVTTFGESHGVALGCIIDGCPSGLEISKFDIQKELDKRKPGQSNITTPRNESDTVEILSGVFNGKTIGTPIACIVRNKDQKSKDYDNIKNVFRPGHADKVWYEKYNHIDYRGGGRSSGRETVARVIAGAIAKKILFKKFQTIIIGHVSFLADIEVDKSDINYSEIEKNIVRCANKQSAEKMIKSILEYKKKSESIGGEITLHIKNVPSLLGNPVFGKIEGLLANAILSCGAVRSFEYGIGKDAKYQKGSIQNTKKEGISGGITTGDDIFIKVSIKPTPSISQNQKVETKEGELKNFVIGGRHDPTIPPRLVPVLESMVALVLCDSLLSSPCRMDQI
jgi:chorismate synthase